MLKNYIFIASGILSTIVVLRILFRKPPPPPDSPELEYIDSLSELPEEFITVTRTLTSRGNTYDKEESIKRPNLSLMRKDQLIAYCEKMGLDTDGTMRVLRSRLKNYIDN